MPPNPPRRPDPTRQSRQSLGMTLAALAGTAGVVVLGWYFFFGTSTPRQALPTTVNGLKAPTGPGGNSPQMSGTNVRIDLMDKKDPTRQAGRLVMAEMDPLEGHHYAAKQPQGFLYLRDGRTIHVRADQGNLYMPDRSKEPESGTLTGNVVVRAFAPKPGGGEADITKGTPVGTIRIDSLAFDNALGKADSPDPFSIEMTGVKLTGRGLRIIFNQVKQRLELLEIARGEELRYTRVGSNPPPSNDTPAKPPPAGGAAPVGAAPAGPVAPRTPVETLYKIVFNDGVTTTQEQRVIKSDKLQVWARLVDNALPDGAVAPVRSAKVASAAKTPPAAGAPTGEKAAATPGELTAARLPADPTTSLDIPPENGPLVLRWTGPCVIVPLDAAPPELTKDHVALRYTGEESGLVTFEDASRNAKGHGAYIEYGATTRRLVLAGPGPASAAMDLGGTRKVEAVRLETTITDEATIIHVPGPSKLTAYPEHAEPNARAYTISCVEQADYTLANANGAVTDNLKQAVFQGQVKAEDPTGMKLEGDSIRVEFQAVPGQPSLLKQLIVDGHAVATTADSARLAADHLDATFRAGQDGKNPEPVQMTATGRFTLDRGPTHLEGGFLEATLAKDAKGNSNVTHATARDGVKFADKAQGVSAECDLMKADLEPDTSDPTAPRQIVDLTGERVVLKRADQSTITGTQMRLDGVTHKLEVFSAGTIDHNDAARASGGLASLKASWSRSMAYDDSAGKVSLIGDVVADSSPDAFTRDHLEAERVMLNVTPRKTGQPAAPDLTQAGTRQDKERRLLRAEAVGAAFERAEGGNARLESRRYLPDDGAPGGQRLVELYYVEGPRVIADNDKGTVDVPERGRMLLLDHRGDAPVPGATGPGMAPPPRDGRGSALFDWDGSMHMDRPSGEVHMKRAVRLTHQKLDTREVTDLSADDVTATFRQKPASPGQGEDPVGARGELVSALAVGSVHISMGPAKTPGQPRPPSRELAADRLMYDAQARTADATALPGGVVRMFDPTRATPMTAARIFWDMARDRVEIKDPGAITAPK